MVRIRKQYIKKRRRRTFLKKRQRGGLSHLKNNYLLKKRQKIPDWAKYIKSLY